MTTGMTTTIPMDTGTRTSIDPRLLQLASPALPVGAYSYSQGLEAAVASGTVRDGAGAARWIGDVLEFSVARLEAPLLARMVAAWQRDDRAAVQSWNELFLASRETAELRAETVQMGFSLDRLLAGLGVGGTGLEEPSYPCAYARAVAAWELDGRQALVAYLWSWLENQVMAALKCVPLGQTEAQAILLDLGGCLGGLAGRALVMEEEALANFAPGLALAASRHETQYSRLFRS